MPSLSTTDLLNKRISLAKNAQQEKWNLFTDLDEIYHVKGKQQEAEAQMHAPDSWANVETVAPRMIAKRPTLIFKPRPDPFNQGKSEEEKARTSDLKAAIWEHWWDKDGAFIKNVAWNKGSLRHGTKMVRTGWKYEVQEVSNYRYGPDGLPQVDPATGKFFEDIAEEVTFDDATMETISSYDFMIDPEAKDVQSAAWIIFRYRKTIDELKQYGQFTKLKELEGILTDNDESPQAMRSRNISGMASLEDDSTIDRVTCYEMWQKGKKGIEKCTVAAAKIEIEKWRPNPFKHRKYPFIRLIDSIVDEEFWGKGEIEPVKYFQWSLDTYHSMDVANRIAALQAKWKVDGNVDEWELFNGRVIHVNTTRGDDANPVEVPDYTKTSMPAIEGTRGTMSNALGIFDVNRGDSTPANQTATGIGITAEQGNARFNLKIQLYEDALKELGEQIISLYQQHKTDYFTIEVPDATGVKQSQIVAPGDIAGASNIEVESGSSRPADKEAERTDALQIYQLTQPVQAQDPEFAMEVMKFVLSKFDGAAKVTDALDGAYQRIEAKMQAEQQAQMAAQQQAQDAAQATQTQAQGAQQEQGAIADHKAYLDHFKAKEDNLNKRIQQVTAQVPNQPVAAPA